MKKMMTALVLMMSVSAFATPDRARETRDSAAGRQHEQQLHDQLLAIVQAHAPTQAAIRSELETTRIAGLSDRSVEFFKHADLSDQTMIRAIIHVALTRGQHVRTVESGTAAARSNAIQQLSPAARSEALFVQILDTLPTLTHGSAAYNHAVEFLSRAAAKTLANVDLATAVDRSMEETKAAHPELAAWSVERLLEKCPI